MISKLIAIIRNTFTETIRQPIFSVLVWTAAFWVALVSPALAAYSLESGNDIKVMKDVGLATALLFGLLASAFTASGVITREIESFTVMTVVSKPVSRPLFLLGKYCGVALAVLVGHVILSIALMLAARHGVMETVTDKYDQPVLLFGIGAVVIGLIAATFGNYVYGWNFPTTLFAWVTPLAILALGLVLFISPKWELQSPGQDFGDLQLVYALALVYLGVLVLAAFAVALATRFGQVMTLMLCAAIFMMGLLSDYYLGRHLDQGPIFSVLYAIVPNFQFFWVGDALAQQDPKIDALRISAGHVGWVAGYAAAYCSAVLCVGIAMFQTREVG